MSLLGSREESGRAFLEGICFLNHTAYGSSISHVLRLNMEIRNRCLWNI